MAGREDSLAGGNIYPFPTSEIIGALQDVLPQADADFMEGMEPDEVKRYLIAVLPEHGIENPEEYLRQKGILE